jgi:hypothetical protein
MVTCSTYAVRQLNRRMTSRTHRQLLVACQHDGTGVLPRDHRAAATGLRRPVEENFELGSYTQPLRWLGLDNVRTPAILHADDREIASGEQLFPLRQCSLPSTEHYEHVQVEQLGRMRPVVVGNDQLKNDYPAHARLPERSPGSASSKATRLRLPIPENLGQQTL